MANFMFVIKDLPIGERNIVAAEEIAETLISDKIWIFHENTANLSKLRSGDNILVYIGGYKKKHFVGGFKIAGEIQNFSNNEIRGERIKKLVDKLCMQWMTLFIEIESAFTFEKPIAIKPLVQSLHFIKDKQNYGLHLRLSIIQLADQDYELILSAAKP